MRFLIELFRGKPTDNDLLEAVKNGTVAGIDDLVRRGANVNASEAAGKTALMYAADSGRADVVELLIQNGADVNAKTEDYYKTALMFAVSKGHAEVARLLVEAGADVNAEEKSRMSVLMQAASGGHVDIIRLLIERGVTVTKPALFWADNLATYEVLRDALRKDGVDTTLDAFDHVKLATLFSKERQYDLAIREYEAAQRKEPDNLDVLVGFGDLYREHGKLEEAVALYLRALELDPKLAQPYLNLAGAYEEEVCIQVPSATGG